MRIDRKSAALGAATAIIVGAGGIAYATMASADPSPTPTPSSGYGAPPAPRDDAAHRAAEQELTGTTAAKVKAAVLAKLPGATVDRMSAEDPAEGTGAAYEAHVIKADGTHVEVLLDKAFAVTKVTAMPDRPGFGRGGHGPGGHNEAALTGTTAAKVKAAVLAKLPGATVDRMSAEDPAEGTGAAYEAHVTKADGTHVEVLLDKAFAVTKVTAMPDRPGFGRGGHGPGGTPPSAYDSTST